MTPYEMMLSESQERMLIILEDGKEKEAKIFDKWDLDFVVIGKTTNSNNLSLKYNNKIVGEIPIEALASKHLYDRKWIKRNH